MPTVPGYDVLELIGSGAGCDVHRATRRATGEQVAVKVPRSPAAAAGLRAEAAALRAVDSPYVVRVVEVLDGALVLGLAEGGSVAELLTRRGALPAGQVVTVVGPLAQALAAVHAAGLVHGDVAPANLLLTADGMPLLADLSAARAVGDEGPVDATPPWVDPAVVAGAPPSPASDVWSLAAVCHALLAGAPPDPEVGAPLSLLAPRTPRALLDALAAALAPDPGTRPGAAQLAAAVHAACPAEPVLPVPAAELRTRRVRPAVEEVDDAPPARSRWWRPSRRVRSSPTAARPPSRRAAGGPRRLPSRRLAVVAGALAALVLAAGLGAASSRWGSAPAGAALPGVATDWRAVLDRLDGARAAALAAADPGPLASAWAPGSDGLAADTAAVERLADSGRVAVGVRHVVVSVVERRVAADRVLLRVVDALPAHELRDASGRVVQRVAARSERTWDVALVRLPDARGAAAWRLAEVLPA